MVILINTMTSEATMFKWVQGGRNPWPYWVACHQTSLPSCFRRSPTSWAPRSHRRHRCWSWIMWTRQEATARPSRGRGLARRFAHRKVCTCVLYSSWTSLRSCLGGGSSGSGWDPHYLGRQLQSNSRWHLGGSSYGWCSRSGSWEGRPSCRRQRLPGSVCPRWWWLWDGGHDLSCRYRLFLCLWTLRSVWFRRVCFGCSTHYAHWRLFEPHRTSRQDPRGSAGSAWPRHHSYMNENGGNHLPAWDSKAIIF